MNLLFVCSHNQLRSPTAEVIFSSGLHKAKSAGTSPSAKFKVSQKLLNWADLIFVMEQKHKEIIRQQLGQEYDQRIIVLDIPDAYSFMDPELVELLKTSVEPYLEDSSNPL